MKPANPSMDWESFFAWASAAYPMRMLDLPMADFECAVCGQLNCAADHENDE